ncbi:MAG TPA: HAMP domain-containing sensor histidine kinase [Polyangiales bacterium]|nr:HAMP domain-containing sensor histidine kinase [Polyangiales bacterium]
MRDLDRASLRSWSYASLGALGGALFVAFDLLAETRLRSGTLHGFLSQAHAVIDHVLPIIAGALFGLGGHYLHLRSSLRAAEELASRADALRQRLRKLERDQAVWVLAATILHELNNPLHALGLLLDELGDNLHDAAMRNQLIARACAQSDNALSALRRLRSLRNLEAPRFDEIALDRVLSALTQDADALAAQYGLRVRLHVNGSVQAHGDQNYIRTIMENLIQNSLQALSPRQSGEILICVGTSEDRAVITVTDDGPPLEHTQARSIFTPLQSTKQTGLGLGLPIARTLARAMHGDLKLDLDDHKTFRLELPLRSAL